MRPAAAGSSSQRQDRGASEKLRRVQMKSLYSELASLLPPDQPPKDKLSLPKILEKAQTYIKGLTERVDSMKEEKERLQRTAVPSVVVNEMDSYLEINLLLLPGSDKSLMLHEALIILKEEGVYDVLNIDCATLNHKILYTIRCQAFSARIGIATSRVHERLMALIGSPAGSSSAPPPK